ncbi:MAG TPA: DUF3179 domain-containing protein [Nitrososphaeraceae archaeon]|nr:DUF3179 domain-containing protein [Nitrososphaeraceae archaeon]
MNNNNKKSNHHNEKIKLNFILLISLSVSIVLLSAIVFLSTDEEKNIFKLSLGQEIKHTVPLDKIVSGGPPQDGIPSIDNPKFQSVQEADEILEDSELILGLNINGDIRAYPLQILVWHEIVNDVVGDQPVAVTYFPLCFTNQVFNRTLSDGNTVEFGTSGKLYNSNLVMYDRKSNSLWSQALGEGIVGEYAGVKLERIPFDVAYWKEWKELYPESKVLSRDTGSVRPYGADPYGDYYTNDLILFPVANDDKRLGLKEIIIGLENNKDQYKAYKLQDIETNKVINDVIGKGKKIALVSLEPFMVRVFDRVIDNDNSEESKKEIVVDLFYNQANNTLIDKVTDSELNFEGNFINGQLKDKQLNRLPMDQGFWFEWAAFHPETEVFAIN